MAGLPFFVVPHTLGAMATGNALSSNPVTHLGEHMYAGMTWKSSGASGVWARWNFGSALPVNYAGLLAANATASTTARLRLGDNQTEVDGTADYDSSAQAIRNPSGTPADINGLYHWHWELPSLQTKQWGRLDIGSHSGDFEASMLVLGEKITVSRYYETPYERGYEDLGAMSLNRFGVPDVTDGVNLRVIQFTLGWMTEDEIETKILPMIGSRGRRKPLLLCFDPEESTYRQGRTYFGFMREGLRPRKVRFNQFESQFEFLSII